MTISAITKKNHSSYAAVICMWIVLITASLLGKQYYIFSQFMVQSLILIVLIYLILQAAKTGVSLHFHIGALDLFLPLLAILYLVLTLAHDNRYQGFLALMDIIIYCLCIFVFNYIYQSSNIIQLYLPVIGSSLIIAILGMVQKFSYASQLGYANINIAALHIFVAILLSYQCARHYGYRSMRGIIFLCIIVVDSIALAFYPSRSVYLVIILFTLYLLASHSLRHQKSLVKIAAIMVLMLAIAGFCYKAMKTSYQWERLSIWKTSFSMLAGHASTGVGPGNYQAYAYQYNFPTYSSEARFGKFANHAHSQWLTIACEGGLLSILLLLFFFYHIIVLSRSLMQKKMFAGIPVLAFYSILLFGCFNNFFDSYAIMLVFIAVIAGLQQHAGMKLFDIAIRPTRLSAGLPVVCLIITLVMFVYIPYQAHRNYSRAIQAIQRGNTNKALTLINAAIAGIPVNSAYYRTRAGIRIMKFQEHAVFSDIPLIVRDYALAESVNKLDFNAYIETAQFYASLSQRLRYPDLLHNAIINYKLALNYNPFNPFYHSGIARCYAGLGKFQEAEKELLQSITLEPNYIEGNYELYRIYARMNNKEKADLQYAQSLALAKKFRFYPTSNNQYLNALLNIPDELQYAMVGSGLDF